MKKELLIFDFDGTIADSKAAYYSAISSELKQYGFNDKEVDKAIDVGMSLRKTLGNLGLNFITSWLIKKSIMKKMKNQVDKIKKCKDVDAIKKIKLRKIVITNSLKEFAIPVLKHLKLIRCFEAVYGADDFNDKAEFIKDYLKQRKIEKKNCYYIGDRAADVKVARKAGCKSIIISGKCAWDSRKEVIRARPDFVVDDIKNLDEIFECAQKCKHE